MITSLGVAAAQGLISSLSACVYPLIPITTALFGAGQVKHWGQGFFLSTIYVLGMSLTYVALGVTAALTGTVFGAYLGNPWVIAGFTAMFFYLGLAFIGVLPLPLPNFANAMQVKKKSTLGYPLLLGIISGFIAAPCTAPLFGALLLDIASDAAKSNSIIPGVSQAFAFSLGMGLPFFLIGGFALKLPKPGNWLQAVKYFGGAVLMAAGFHYLEDIIGPFPPEGMLVAAVITGLFLFITFIILSDPLNVPEPGKESKTMKLKSASFLVIAAFGLFLLTAPFATGSSAENSGGEAKWHTDLSDGLSIARKKDSYVIVDFWAEWCHACHEMEKSLFHSPEFLDYVKANNITLVRLNADEESVGAVAERYAVRGLPTLVIVNEQGEMIYKTIGFRSNRLTMSELDFAAKRYMQKEE